jgi:hypothetical protein
MPELSIIMYHPTIGNYEHWALCLSRGFEKTIYEVTGQHPNFLRSVSRDHSLQSRRIARILVLATIREEDVEQMEEIIKGVKVDNETSEWNCQDYCVEALDRLAEECVIDEDDGDFKRGRRMAVGEYFGAIL